MVQYFIIGFNIGLNNFGDIFGDVFGINCDFKCMVQNKNNRKMIKITYFDSILGLI